MPSDMDVIAERELQMLGPEPRRVFVRLGRPIRQETGEWECPTQLLGIDDTLRGICGEDSMHALQLALEFVAIQLRPLQGQLSWFGDPEDGIGFPRAIPMMMPPAHAGPIELIIDEAAARWSTEADARIEEALGE